jgi:capsular polysaccharide biosynthesis protein
MQAEQDETTPALSGLAEWELGGARLGRTWPMLSVKQALESLPQARAFEIFLDALARPPGARLVSYALHPVIEAARRAGGDYFEISPPGAAFVNTPPRVIGEGDQRLISHAERSLYVVALGSTAVHGRSQLLLRGPEALLDYEGEELGRINDELRLDSIVFRHEADRLQLLEEPGAPELHVAEAFSLLGPNTYAFGHWIVEYLPRLWLALESGRMARVTLLIDRGMAQQHRQLLEMLAPPGSEILEVEPLQRVRVDRLWFAPSFYYAPLYPQFDARFRYDYVAVSPRLFGRLFGSMWQRLESQAEAGPANRRLYLARRPDSHRKLINHAEIEELAISHGFERVYMEDLDIAAQLRLLRSSSHLLGPEGSAFFLAFFARAGTRVCILNHPHVEFLTEVTALIDETGAETTVFTGPFERIEEGGYVHFSDYRIDADALSGFLARWAPAARGGGC